MPNQNQNLMEPLDSRMSETPFECQESSSAHRPYRSPQVFAVGKAKRLMAGDPFGAFFEGVGGWSLYSGGPVKESEKD